MKQGFSRVDAALYEAKNGGQEPDGTVRIRIL